MARGTGLGGGDKGCGRFSARCSRENGYWRDILSFSWERPTFAGREAIEDGFVATVALADPRNLRVAAARTAPRFARRSGRNVIEGWFDFDTAVGSGAGFARLVYDGDGVGDGNTVQARAWLLLTTLQELRGSEEKVGALRPTGEHFSKIESPVNWAQERAAESAFEGRDPQVLVVGAGQGGLILGARLRQMGVDVLIVEKGERVGDVWRNRYNNLTLHNKLTANHFPYMPFPETWPIWLPKDMLGDWLEAYAKFMELNVWTGTELSGATFDEDEKLWTVRLSRAGQPARTVPGAASGDCHRRVGGAPQKTRHARPVRFRGRARPLWRVLHGRRLQGPQRARRRHGKQRARHRAGSVHQRRERRDRDAARTDLRAEPRAQRDHQLRHLYRRYIGGGYRSDGGGATGTICCSTRTSGSPRRPTSMTRSFSRSWNAIGFKTHTGEDKTGFQLLYLRGAGGYYIDIGCADLMINGDIELIQYEDADRFVAEGLRMRDGRVIPLDLVVQATGFESMAEMTRRLLGDAVADRVGKVWGFDENDNIRNMWTRTPQDGLWLMGRRDPRSAAQLALSRARDQCRVEGVATRPRRLAVARTGTRDPAARGKRLIRKVCRTVDLARCCGAPHRPSLGG